MYFYCIIYTYIYYIYIILYMIYYLLSMIYYRFCIIYDKSIKYMLHSIMFICYICNISYITYHLSYIMLCYVMKYLYIYLLVWHDYLTQIWVIELGARGGAGGTWDMLRVAQASNHHIFGLVLMEHLDWKPWFFPMKYRGFQWSQIQSSHAYIKGTYGGFLKWRYPQSSSIFSMGFSTK